MNKKQLLYVGLSGLGLYLIYEIINANEESEANFGGKTNFFGGIKSFFSGLNPSSGGTTTTMGTTTTTTTGTTSINAGIPSGYQSALNAFLNQYGQVKYKDCYNKFLIYAQQQGLQPSYAQYYPEMVSFMRTCLGGTNTNTTNDTGNTGNTGTQNPYQEALTNLEQTLGAEMYKKCLNAWYTYAQQNGITTSNPNYYYMMYQFMMKCK
jgi:hypothetical protein